MLGADLAEYGMATFGYLVLGFAGLIGALLVALGTHAAHAYLQAYPDKLFDGDGLGDMMLNEMLSPNYNVFGRYDDAGWWEFYSLRNYALHAGPWLIATLAVVAVNWGDRVQIVAQTCSGLGRVGMVPMFCG
jgi:hypothetical protein